MATTVPTTLVHLLVLTLGRARGGLCCVELHGLVSFGGELSKRVITA